MIISGGTSAAVIAAVEVVRSGKSVMVVSPDMHPGGLTAGGLGWSDTGKKEDCENLLVPVCVSSSHIAFGSIRMEPVFMILGQSVAVAASIAIDKNLAVQDVDYEVLKALLLEKGQVLTRKERTR